MQHRTATYRELTNNGIEDDNNGNTACNTCRTDRGRKRTSHDRARGSGDRTDHNRHRAYHTTEKPKEETKPTATEKQTEPSAAENPKENGCITIVETDDPPKEEIIIPPKPSADIVTQKVAEYINKFRTEQGDITATVIPGLTEYCQYRCTQLKTNFAHDTTDQRAAAKALQYGEYVDWSLYGIEGEKNYYTANVREAIGKGNWGGTADEIAYSIANGFRNSKGHWSYVGSSKYTYMAVGVMYDGYYWYVCVCMDSENTDLK